ncbi:MAG: FecR domain-containing protein [Rhodospirillaceae bacterium]|nr:FecR domain-containing protein [Rhodospirillaceae bacterium]
MSDPETDHIWRQLDRLRDRPVVQDARDYADAWAKENAEVRRQGRWGFLFANLQRAAVGAVIAIGLIAAGTTLMPSMFSSEQRVAYDSPPTQGRDVRLDDGSVVQMNAASRAEVAFTKENRLIDLQHGEARFEVAKDANRPFRVKAGAVEVVAIGTVFDVDSRHGRTNITLIEGRVDVRILYPGVDTPPTVERLVPGQKIIVAADGRVLNKREVRVATAPAWRRGMIDLDDVPLNEALAELNRYSDTKIVIQDKSLAIKPISGSFRMGDTVTVVAALEQFFGLKARQPSPQLIVLEKPPE